ncbi:pentapeptide repeat-containing protein [Sorangium sp. So ce513]|uniref:pentapeptide repeat-containing protein n=1 Tax=Sorangium sp. So ce513 TaxID=3133315 RepID=UPI003F6178F9
MPAERNPGSPPTAAELLQKSARGELAGSHVSGAAPGIDRRGADLTEALWRDVDLRGAPLSGVILRNMNHEGADLAHADFTGLLFGVPPGKARRLAGVGLREAAPTGVFVHQVALTGAKLSGALLARAEQRAARLQGAESLGVRPV